MRSEGTSKPRVKHQEKEWRRERFGVKFMERDVAGGRRDQHRTGQEKRRFSIEAESQPDAERHRPHRSEGGVLDHDENHRMAEEQEKRSNQETRSARHDFPRSGTP